MECNINEYLQGSRLRGYPYQLFKLVIGTYRGDKLKISVKYLPLSSFTKTPQLEVYMCSYQYVINNIWYYIDSAEGCRQTGSRAGGGEEGEAVRGSKLDLARNSYVPLVRGFEQSEGVQSSRLLKG